MHFLSSSSLIWNISSEGPFGVFLFVLHACGVLVQQYNASYLCLLLMRGHSEDASESCVDIKHMDAEEGQGHEAIPAVATGQQASKPVCESVG